MRRINIPTELIKKYKGSKQSLELFAFAVCIKMLHTNSVLTNASLNKIAAVFHISKKKAMRLLEQAKSDDLFDYNPTTKTIRIKSFKSDELKQANTKRLQEYFSDYCFSPHISMGCVLKVDGKPVEYKLQTVYNALREALIANAINSDDRNNSTKGQGVRKHSELTQQKLANIAGMKRTSCRNALKRMKQAGKIAVTSAIAMCVISSVNAQSVQEWREKSGSKNFIYNPNNNSGWIVKPSEYSISDRTFTNCFRHVIYDHKKRVNNNKQSYIDIVSKYMID